VGGDTPVEVLARGEVEATKEELWAASAWSSAITATAASSSARWRAPRRASSGTPRARCWWQS